MVRTPLKTQLRNRIASSASKVFLRKDFADLGGYDQVGRGLRGLIAEGSLSNIGYGLYAQSTKDEQGKVSLLHSSESLRQAAFSRLNVDPERQGRFSRQLKLPADSAYHTPPPSDNSQRRSQQFNLSFPYDWSNPHMRDALLIDKVLEKSRFDDVLRIAYYFGIDRVQGNAHTLYGEQLPRRLKAMLNNIRIGLSRNQNAA